MTTTIISSGQIQSGATLFNGDVEIVLSGGRVVSTIVSSGAQQFVSSGGAAALITVLSGGHETIDGGLLTSGVIAAGGTVDVISGGMAQFDTVSAGGMQMVSAGGFTASSVVAGTEVVGSGGATSATTAFGTQVVSNGGSSDLTAVFGTQFVYSGGDAAASTINAGGVQMVSGGMAERTRDLGEQDIVAGGNATSTTISSGGLQVISMGGLAIATLVNSGGLVSVQGGTLVGSIVGMVGEVDVSFGETSGTVLAGVESLVGSRGVAVALRTGIQSSGVQYVGSNAITSATLVNAGGIQFIDHGGQTTLTVIDSGGLMEVNGFNGSASGVGGVASGTIVLSGGTLQVLGSAGVTVPGNDIVGTRLEGGGTIDLATLAFAVSETANLVSGDVLAITGGPSGEIDLQLAGGYTGEYFHLSDDGAGGTDITVDGTPCFCRGTLIATSSGEVAVEDLRIGHLLATKSGVLRELRWIGRRSYSGRFAAGNRDVMPVVFRVGAMGGGLPRRDLMVSPLHAMMLDGVLIPAACLTNGQTIVQVRSMNAVEYFHLELDSHDIIVAEGVPTESYVEDANRGMFHNAAEFAAQYPNAARRAAVYCLPRVEHGPVLERVRLRLAGEDKTTPPAAPVRGWLDRVERGRIVGWAQGESGPVMLRIIVNGATVGEIVADQPREDVHDHVGGHLDCGFVFDIPGGLSTERVHLIQVQRAADGAELPGSPYRQQAQSLARTDYIDHSPLRGNVDRADRRGVLGWAHDGSDTPVWVQVLDNGVMIGSVLANRWRADVAEAGVGAGRHAFEFNFPAPLSATASHMIEVRRESDGAILPGSPIAIAASDSFNPALEQTIADAVAALDGTDRDRVLSFILLQAERLKQKLADADSHRADRALAREALGSPKDAETCLIVRRVLVIDAIIPAADRDAGSCAILSHIRSLQRLGYEVSFVASEQMQVDGTSIADVGVLVCGAPVYASVEDVLRRQAGCFDVIYMHRAAIAESYMALARRWMPAARIIYSVADLHHVRLARQAVVEERPELMAASRRMRLVECTFAWQADVVLTHSPVEAIVVRDAVPKARVHVVPWDVQTYPTRAPFGHRSGVAFIGNYGHGPNIDAARFLVEDVMPLVWAKDASITCHLAGYGMPAVVRELARPGVVLHGHVSDLATIFNAVRLTVAPMRSGAGIKGKVLDSLAAGVPVAATPIAAEGLDLPADSVGQDAPGIADVILRLHGDAKANRTVATAGLTLIRRLHTTAQVDAALKAAIGFIPQQPAVLVRHLSA